MSRTRDGERRLASGLVLLGLAHALAACAGEPTSTKQAPPTLSAAAGAIAPVGSDVTDTPAVAPVTTTTTPAGSAAAPTITAPLAGSSAVLPPVTTTTTSTAAAAAATYHRDIRPIIEARCLGCHVDGGVGRFALNTWEAVDMYKSVILPAVTSRRMPPWPADDTDCVKHRNKQRLSDQQIGLFMKWQADGFQEGDSSLFAPLVEDEPAKDIGEPNLIVTPRPFQLTPNLEDYICSQTDANLSEDVWIRALDVKPEHPEYVHHAIVNVGSGTQCDALGLTQQNIYSYRPGSRTVIFEEGDAMLLRKGERILIQFHYNTRGAKPATSYPTDASPLRLWTLPSGQKPMRQIHRQPVHARNINIPPGAVDQAVRTTAALEAGAGAEIIGISPHMHFLGQTFKQMLSGAGMTNMCLVTIPDWDQGWQIDYLFKPEAYIKAASGMTISQECVYSNRPEDQGIGPDGKPYTPQFTTFGEDTRNEMCLGYVWYRQPLAATGFN